MDYSILLCQIRYAEIILHEVIHPYQNKASFQGNRGPRKSLELTLELGFQPIVAILHFTA